MLVVKVWFDLSKMEHQIMTNAMTYRICDFEYALYASKVYPIYRVYQVSANKMKLGQHQSENAWRW